MRLTVALCTWNRASLLRQTLGALTHLRAPVEAEWELLVVDNNSTDDTPAVVDSFAGSLPLRRLHEPEPGLSHARNRALDAATGDYILFTDDDVIVDPEWLSVMRDAFGEWPAAVVFGGNITPLFEGGAPKWISDAIEEFVATGSDILDGPFGLVDMPEGPVELHGPKLPFGANMAYRTEVLRDYRFDPRLGRKAKGGLAAEETDAIRRMLGDGHTGRWVPGARLQHVIPPERQTVEFLRGYFRTWGATLAATNSYEGATTLFGRPLWMWREAVELEAKYRLRSVLGHSPGQWVSNMALASRARGGLTASGTDRG